MRGFLFTLILACDHAAMRGPPPPRKDGFRGQDGFRVQDGVRGKDGFRGRDSRNK